MNIEELAKKAGMNVSMWNYGAGSIVFTMGTEGVARGAIERFASLILDEASKEVRKDSERLNWLDENAGRHTFHIGGTWYVRGGHGHPHFRAGSIRAAIDAAIAQEQK